MASTPLVTVVIPTYNRATMVGRAIESVLQQTFSDFEIVVVDDSSHDNTESVVKGFGDHRVRYIRHEINKKLPATRNTGIANARGQYIAFLDDDDQWKKDKLCKQIDAIQNCEAVLCASTVTGIKPTYRYREDWVTSSTLRKGNIFDPSGLIVRAEVLRKLQFDTSLPNGVGEDWDMFIRIAERGKIKYIPEPLVIYNDGQGHARITNRQAGMSISELEKHTRILEKHHDFFGPFWFHVHVAETLLSYIGSRKRGRVRQLLYTINRCGITVVTYVLLRKFGRRLGIC